MSEPTDQDSAAARLSRTAPVPPRVVDADPELDADFAEALRRYDRTRAAALGKLGELGGVAQAMEDLRRDRMEKEVMKERDSAISERDKANAELSALRVVVEYGSATPNALAGDLARLRSDRSRVLEKLSAFEQRQKELVEQLAKVTAERDSASSESDSARAAYRQARSAWHEAIADGLTTVTELRAAREMVDYCASNHSQGNPSKIDNARLERELAVALDASKIEREALAKLAKVTAERDEAIADRLTTEEELRATGGMVDAAAASSTRLRTERDEWHRRAIRAARGPEALEDAILWRYDGPEAHATVERHRFIRGPESGPNRMGPPEETCAICQTDPRNGIHDEIARPADRSTIRQVTLANLSDELHRMAKERDAEIIERDKLTSELDKLRLEHDLAISSLKASAKVNAALRKEVTRLEQLTAREARPFAQRDMERRWWKSVRDSAPGMIQPEIDRLIAPIENSQIRSEAEQVAELERLDALDELRVEPAHLDELNETLAVGLDGLDELAELRVEPVILSLEASAKAHARWLDDPNDEAAESALLDERDAALAVDSANALPGSSLVNQEVTVPVTGGGMSDLEMGTLDELVTRLCQEILESKRLIGNGWRIEVLDPQQITSVALARLVADLMLRHEMRKLEGGK